MARRGTMALVLVGAGAGMAAPAAHGAPVPCTTTATEMLCRLDGPGTGELVVPEWSSRATVDIQGARGGIFGLRDLVTRKEGGAPSRFRGRLALVPGEVLHLFAGGAGNQSTEGGRTVGGFNGGGNGSEFFIIGAFALPGGGGGASDVRRGGAEAAHRIVVAGGGGGASYERSGGDAGSPGRDGVEGGCARAGRGGGAATGATGGTGGAAGSSAAASAGTAGNSAGQGGFGGRGTLYSEEMRADAAGAGGGGGFAGGGGGGGAGRHICDGGTASVAGGGSGGGGSDLRSGLGSVETLEPSGDHGFVKLRIVRTFESFLADSRGPDGAGGVVTTGTMALNAGRRYHVTVKGTYSAFNASLMSGTTQGWSVCGAPEARPMFASPDVENGRVSQDAEFLFARPQFGSCGATTYPRRFTTVPVLTLSTTDPQAFAHPTPIAASLAEHTYTYRVTGSGLPLSVRVSDTKTSDNYGRFRVTVELR